MIVIDSSALMAVIFREPDADIFMDLLLSGPTVIGAPTLVESHVVLIRRGLIREAELLGKIILASDTATIAFDGAMTALATVAFERFGRTRHPAALNYGDCMAYAVAKALDAPLLFKGRDFAQTDIRAALG